MALQVQALGPLINPSRRCVSFQRAAPISLDFTAFQHFSISPHFSIPRDFHGIHRLSKRRSKQLEAVLTARKTRVPQKSLLFAVTIRDRQSPPRAYAAEERNRAMRIGHGHCVPLS